MNESHITGYIASAMQFIVAVYALRLNRRFGTARVGWSLFGAFGLLALLQLIQSTASFNVSGDSALKINVTYALISFLLLISLLHLETMLKERLRMEQVEHQLRANLELEVQAKTAHLNRAIEELVREIEETKRMTAIIESSEWTTTGNTADAPASNENSTATTVFNDSNEESHVKILPVHFRSKRESEEEHFLVDVLGGAWAAQI